MLFRAASSQWATAAVCISALALLRCGGRLPATQRAQARAESGESPIERLVVDRRPALTLVARGGDPHSAVAFVATHARGSVASAALAGLLAARMQGGRDDLPVLARAHGLGFVISAQVDRAVDAQRFVRRLREVLAQPVQADEPALARARSELDRLRSAAFSGSGEAAAAACSGEFGHFQTAAIWDLGHSAGLAALEAARRAVFAPKASAFAALGSSEVLDAAGRALEDSPAWPDAEAEQEKAALRDEFYVDAVEGRPRLIVALRVGDADAAVTAGTELGSADSELLQHLATFTPKWKLERSLAISRVRGACLRLDLSLPDGTPAPAIEEVAKVAAITNAIAERALTHGVPGALDESVMRPTDALRACELAAWRGLSGSNVELPPRRVVAYLGERAMSKAGTPELEAAFARYRSELGRPELELVSRAEPGQGEFWMLVGSPCGTGPETNATAGAGALAMLTLARRATEVGVRLEAWVTPDGVGLLAHSPRLDSDESAADHAARVARALGRAWATPITGPETAQPRASLLDALGGRPYPALARALEGLAPDHPSWLEPRGTFAQVAELSSEEVERARRQLLVGPLRVAVLASRGEAQVSGLRGELGSWLLPWRGRAASCPDSSAVSPQGGEVRLMPMASSAGLGPEPAYVGVAWPDSGNGARSAPELIAWLLNRPGGPLERASRSLQPSVGARAHVYGGKRRPAVLVEIRALPEQLTQAVGSVRAALDRVAQSGFNADELRTAQLDISRAEDAARGDPRKRLVDLWRGETGNDSGLQGRSHAGELSPNQLVTGRLAASHHWVVLPSPIQAAGP
ncbi:MAG TPA: hypothetical protein VFQ61_30410 [Polyangiaceae bacterium]|nr:hypothetical protein [Polyangiaceae bacterium]